MFGQLTNQNPLPRFRVVTSLDGKNGRLIQTLLRGGKDTK